MASEGVWTDFLESIPSRWSVRFWTAWAIAGCALLLYAAWTDPVTGPLFGVLSAYGAPPWLIRFVLSPLSVVARGILIVEAFGYVYHRFFQHLGWLTRRSAVMRRNQMYHWIHHMVIYPIGRFYRRAMPYVDSEDGIAWSWVVPAVLACAAAPATMGWRWSTLLFAASIAGYAKLIVETAHERFHLVRHPWMNSAYYQWLEKIHLLHHWDQRNNFTIVHPMMDALFGTYLSPRTHARELKVAMEDAELTASDLINWRYLLKEATPAEYAAFISQARRHSPSVRKLDRLLATFQERLETHPQDREARELYARTRELARLVRVPGSQAVAA
ncbi:MAG: hypothetical protein HY551_04040 [Elusimicrobia bacterium]|nr:hypothetical protein [Elusimicrobiota bacterium]